MNQITLPTRFKDDFALSGPRVRPRLSEFARRPKHGCRPQCRSIQERLALAASLCVSIVSGCLLTARPVVAGQAQLIRTIQNPLLPAVGWTDGWGSSIVGFGGDIAVGIPYADPPGGQGNDGLVEVFDAQTGALLRTFQDTFPTFNGEFGSKVAAVNGRVYTGAPNDYTFGSGGFVEGGRAFNLNPSTGTTTAITAPLQGYQFHFGNALASAGTNIMIGAEGQTVSGATAGVVYVLSATGGPLFRTIADPEPANNDLFGSAVGAYSSRLLVGAIGKNNYAGKVYVYDSTTGALVRSIPNPLASAFSYFGYQVTSVGANFAVSAYGQSVGSAASAGVVYLYDGTTFNLLATIPDPTPSANDWFGFSMADFNGKLLVGSPNGKAYLFDGTNGSLLTTITNPNPTDGHYPAFGQAVSSVNGNILVASDNAVYIFSTVPEPSGAALATLAGFVIGALLLLNIGSRGSDRRGNRGDRSLAVTSRGGPSAGGKLVRRGCEPQSSRYRGTDCLRTDCDRR